MESIGKHVEEHRVLTISMLNTKAREAKITRVCILSQRTILWTKTKRNIKTSVELESHGFY